MEKLFNLFGIYVEWLPVLAGIVTVLVNAIKVNLGVKGKWNLLSGLIISLLISAKIYWPAWDAAAVNTLIVLLISIGAWETVKLHATKTSAVANNKG